MRNTATEIAIARALLKRAHTLEWTDHVTPAYRVAVKARQVANDMLMALPQVPMRLLWERDLRLMIADANSLIDICLAD